MTELIAALDTFEGLNWEVACQDEKDFVILESRDIGVPVDKKTGLAIGDGYHMRIFVRKNNFKIIVIRPVHRYLTSEDHVLKELGVPSPIGSTSVRVMWQSKAKGIAYSGKTTVLEVEKPGMARYLGQFPGSRFRQYIADISNTFTLGFGEQGGRQLLKTKVIVDYFSK